MTPEEWQRVRPILESALEMEPSSRSSFLDGACADASLRCEVESLIASHEQAGTDFLNSPPVLADLPEEETRFRLLPGKRIGVYEILEEIAQGGMGAVYRAVRADGQYKQQVALKILRAELGAELTATRFRNERQILASLDHPHIAKILDGSTTADGLPYFVMELIDGLPITEFCDQHKLSIDSRLKIFRTVCSAVHYAHQHLVIHRDIKPSNILITSEGVPKLLDFGIAKILDPSLLPEHVTVTAAGLWMMTPEYASPEQLRGEAITTSTDVYSLGLVLYELLAGHHAYRFASHMPHEIARVVLETDPEKPSTAIRRKEDVGEEKQEKAPLTPELVSGLRADSPDKLHRRITGDLDNIVLKAIRKEPGARYNSADQLSEDIRRHLEGRPVLARKSTAAYRFRKYVFRHKVGVAAAALVFLSLLTGMALTLREARIAQRRFNDVRSLANSLIFDIHDSIRDLPGSTPARKLIVDRALQYLDSMAQESRGDLSLQRELATAYDRVGLVQGHYLQSSLGDTQGSLISYQKALEIRKQIDARSSDWNDHLALAKSYSSVANQQWALADKRSALENIARAVAISEGLNAAHPGTWDILHELSFDYDLTGLIGPPSEKAGPENQGTAQESFRKAMAIDREMLRIRPDDLIFQYGYLMDLRHAGDALVGVNDNAALECFKQELEIAQKLHARSTDVRYARSVAFAHSDIAIQCDHTGDYPCSLDNDQQALGIYQELVREDPKNTLLQQGLAIAYANTATELGKAGKPALSLEYMDQSLQIMRSVVSSAPQNAPQRGVLAAIYGSRGANLIQIHKPEAALKEFSEARVIYESFHKADPSDSNASVTVATCVKRMGESAALAGDAKLAADYFQQALTVVEPLLSAPAADLDVLYTAADAYSGLGDLKLQEARGLAQPRESGKSGWIEARSWYLKSLETWHRIEHPSHESPNGFDVGDPAKVAKSLQLCEAALQQTASPSR